MIVKAEGSPSIPPLDGGTYIATCSAVIGIGTHKGEYQGKVNYRKQVIIQWVIADETVDVDGKQQPRVINNFYTASLNEKAKLRADLEAWRGKAFTDEELEGFDLNKLLNIGCMLTLKINDKGRNAVVGVAKLLKGVDAPTVETLSFDVPDDFSKLAELPEWIQKLVMDSVEYKSNTAPEFTPISDDELPF